jgi:hypothetical protein
MKIYIIEDLTTEEETRIEAYSETDAWEKYKKKHNDQALFDDHEILEAYDADKGELLCQMDLICKNRIDTDKPTSFEEEIMLAECTGRLTYTDSQAIEILKEFIQENKGFLQ